MVTARALVNKRMMSGCRLVVVLSNGNLSRRARSLSHPLVRSQEVVGGSYEEAQPGLGYLQLSAQLTAVSDY